MKNVCVCVCVCVCVGIDGGWGRRGSGGSLSTGHRQLLRLLSAATILYSHILLSSRERKTLLATRFPLSLPVSLPLSLSPPPLSLSLSPTSHLPEYQSSPTGNQLEHCVFLARRVREGRGRQDRERERGERGETDIRTETHTIHIQPLS